MTGYDGGDAMNGAGERGASGHSIASMHLLSEGRRKVVSRYLVG